ncbi:MAG: GntR family transcriptional regulator [Lacipirellulaceae bacterium]
MPNRNGITPEANGSNGDQPRYRRIFELLRSQIWQGVYPPGQKLPTEAELMQHFEVSRTTVSRAMRDLEQMGLVDRCRGSGTYVKHRDGNSPVTRLSFLVPWVDSDDRLPYVEGLIYQRIARLAGEAGISIALHCFDSSCHDLRTGMLNAAQKVIDDGVNGVLYYPAELPSDKMRINREIVDQLTQAGIEVVLVDRDITTYPERSEFIRVGFDNRRGGMLLTDHMINQGAKRIAFLGIPEDSTAVNDRLRGFYEAHYQHGLEVDPQLVCAVHEVDLDLDFCRHLMKQIQPDAVIAKMDRFAAILGRHLSFLGVEIGTDLKLAGFDDDPISELLHMPLTTIRLPVDPFAHAAFTAILQRIDEEDFTSRQVIIDTELVIRDSTIATDRREHSAESVPNP